MKKLIMILSMTAALTISSGAFAAAHDGPGMVAAGDGHCMFTLENMFAGPFKACQMPTNDEVCGAVGETNDNADAVQGDGACPEAGAIGFCEMGDIKLYYYEGDAGGLEIGCGFSDGEWTTTE